MVSHDRLRPAATALASELATRLGCERVAIGFVEDRFCRVVALSHGGIGEGRSEALKLFGAAMDEALDQVATVVVPQQAGRPPRIVLAHDALLRGNKGAVCTIPIGVGRELVGAVLLQFADPAALEVARIDDWEHAVALLGPVLHFMAYRERPLRQRVRDRLRQARASLRSPDNGRLRFGLAAAAVVLVALLFVPFEYRIGGNARVEGEIQRVLVAPVDGFLKQSLVRPGDVVKAGQVLAELAEQDLQLEHNR